MTRSRLLLAFAGAAVVTFAVALRAQTLVAANAAADAREAVLALATQDLAHLVELRARRDVVAAARRPPQDVIALVNATLREAGVPADRFKNLEPENDVPTGTGLRRQTLRLQLEQVTVPQLGQFLAAWRSGQSLWTPTSLELTHRPAGPEAGGDPAAADRFDARMVVAATYVDDAKEGAK